MKTRNGLIELLRFVFAVIVIIYHTWALNSDGISTAFGGGYLAVEFFLIVTGFYLAKSTEKSDPCFAGKTAWQITFKKWVKLLPVVGVTVLLHYLLVMCYGLITPAELPYMAYEFLGLQLSGIYKLRIVIQHWYISAMIISLLPLTYLIIKARDLFINCLSAILPLFIYGYICRTHENLELCIDWYGVLYSGILRCAAGLCMGVCAYRLSVFIDQRIKRNVSLNVLAIAWLLISIVYMQLFKKITGDFFIVFLLTLAVGIILSGNFTLPAFWENRLFTFLGEWSVTLYCSHWTMRCLVLYLIKFNGVTFDSPVRAYIILSFVYSLILIPVIRLVRKAAGAIKKRYILPENEVNIT